MKEFKLYEGPEKDDGDLVDVISFLLSKIRELNEVIYLNWFGIVIKIDSNSTKESILKDFKDEFHK